MSNEEILKRQVQLVKKINILEGDKKQMNEILKNVIKKVIEMKYFETQDLDFEDMPEKEKAEHDELLNKSLELQYKLHKEVTEEQWKLINGCLDSANYLSATEQQYMFNRGVKTGLNELSFIKDELGNRTELL